MRLLGILGAGSLMLAAACGGGGGDGGPGPTPQQTLGEITPSVTQLTLNAGGSATIQMTAKDTQGATIANPGAFTFQSGNTAVAQVNAQGRVVGIAAGTTSINISLSRGGITRTATVPVVVTGTLPATATVAAGTAANTFEPQTVAIARNGTVTWTFGAVEHNVNFSGAGAPANIPNTTSASVTRTFATAGDFPYDCNLHAGMSGTVFVR